MPTLTAFTPATPLPPRAPGVFRVLRGTLLMAALGSLAGCADLPPVRALRIASASTSHLLCSATFVSGQDPDQVYAEEIRPEAGMGLVAWGLRYRVDRARREVSTTLAGGVASRAVYRDGLGCLVDRDTSAAVLAQRYAPPPMPATSIPALPAPGLLPMPPEPLAAAAHPGVRAAIDEAFTEPAGGVPRHTKAIVVLHQGRLVGERYGPGVGVATALNGHSMTKSVTAALAGVMVQQGRWQLQQPAPVASWQSTPGDPRRAITLEQLIRMGSGLPLDEYAGAWDPARRMWFDEADMRAYAERAQPVDAPGTRWHYSDRGYMLLSGLLRDAAAARGEPVLDFAHRELLGPLGMANATLELDGQGTPIGDSRLFAPARAWARFGQLYLQDGVVGGRRLLPEGWVAATRRPTVDQAGEAGEAGYGMGFWLNNTQGPNALSGHWGMPGSPAETYFARGYLGQFVVIVPSQQLVVVRMAVSHRRADEDIASVGQLVGQIIAALGQQPGQPPAALQKGG